MTVRYACAYSTAGQMAGIGFELEKLFEKDTYAADTTAYLTAGFVLAGPWIFGVVAILMVTTFTAGVMPGLDQTIFLILVTMAYAIGMFVTSALYLPVTRFVADRLYQGEADSFGPSYAGYCLSHWIVSGVLAVLFTSYSEISPTVRLTTIILTVACTQVVTSVTFIALLRTYFPVAVSFLAGYTTATAASILLARSYGLEGALIGFTGGLCLIAVLLTATLMIQLSYPRHTRFDFLETARVRPAFMIVGIFLAIGTWGDKLLFWYSPEHAIVVAGNLRFYPPYDISFFLGYITAIPAYAHFLLRVETSFARHVRHVYQTLVRREPYRQIRRGKQHLISAMNMDYVSLLKLQAPVTLLWVYYAPAVLQRLGLPPHQAHIVQYITLASAAIVVLQIQILYLLYFDLAEIAAIPAVMYGVGNVVFTRLTIELGYGTYGLGHLAAAFFAATAGVLLVNQYTPKLEKLTLVHFAEEALGFRTRKARS
jgi:uncharacterized membrane protein